MALGITAIMIMAFRILTVMPCNVDITTQEILKLAEAADPSGARTMGVLTKPDLATENATKDAIIGLVQGKRSILKLGYYIVKNRSADDNDSAVTDRVAAEEAFFTAPPWPPIADRCGIASLKLRLRRLLMHISKHEFPHVKLEVERRLLQCKASLETMGPSRVDQTSQRQYLGKLASRFQSITQAALNGYYVGDKILNATPTLRLATRITKLNEVFSDVFWKRGHKQDFGITGDNEGESSLGKSIDELPFEIPLSKYPELHGIIATDDYQCSEPTQGSLLDHITEVYEANRGPELGTVSTFCSARNGDFADGSIPVWRDDTRHCVRGTI